MKVHVNENKRYILETYWVASEIPRFPRKRLVRVRRNVNCTIQGHKLSNMYKDDIYSNMKSLKSDRPHCQHLQILKRKIYGVLLYQILRVRSFKTIFQNSTNKSFQFTVKFQRFSCRSESDHRQIRRKLSSNIDFISIR